MLSNLQASVAPPTPPQDVQSSVLSDILKIASLEPLLLKFVHDSVRKVSIDSIHKDTPTNLYELLEKAASSTSGNGVSVYSPGRLNKFGVQFTYQKLLESARAKAAHLPQIKGITPESVVLLHFDHHQEAIEWFWAVVVAGYIPCISTPFTNDSEGRKKHLSHLRNVLKNPVVLAPKRLVSEFLDVEGLNLHAVESIQQPKENTSWKTTLYPGSIKGPNDIAALMLTSGSTGFAKAVTLRHGQMLTSVAGKSIHHTTNQNDKFLNWIGMDHVANLMETHLHSMSLAADQIHVQAADLLVDPTIFLTLIARHRITHTFAPNFFLASLRKALEKDEPFGKNPIPDISCLRVLISGGEQTVVETVDALTKLLQKLGCNGEVIRPGFGMTETCAGSIYNRNCPSYDIAAKSEFGSLGYCIPGISMRVSGENKEILGKNEIGNLEISGPVVFKGYFNNSEANASSFTKDGWFSTGDRAFIDSTGRLQMTGRAKEDIIINGVKYFPHEIETAIEDARVPGVTPSFTAVFPYRPQGSQTEVINVVYLPSYTSDDIVARVKANDEISTISILQSGVRPYDVIPLTSAQLQKSSLGKLSRPKIRTAYENGLYDEFKATNTNLIKEYRALNLQGPVNDTEVTILKVFSETFDIPANEIGTNTSLFEMGVSSIELIRLKVKIQTALDLKVEIPIIIIMTNPTIASLAASIIDLQIAKPYNPIIPLQKGGDKTPLFLVHPGVGEALVFLNLAKYIVDRPVYALRARGFDLGETQFDSIAEIADCYYTHIKKTQPEGPYAIAGYSLGSMLATEITKLLEAGGDEVKFLGVLNLPPHIKWRMRQLDWVTVLLHLSYFLDLMTEEHAHEINAEMHLLTHDEVLDHILENAPQYRLDEMDLSKEKMRQWADISTGLHTIAHHYDPSGMVSKMDVFHAHPLKAVAPNREEWVEKHLSKWSEFVETEPRFHYCDGGHVTMLGPEHVVTFQKTLRAALKARDA